MRAFTLIELRVEIAIIAILAAVLSPVFVAAKNAAKGTVCLAHMKVVRGRRLGNGITGQICDER